MKKSILLVVLIFSIPLLSAERSDRDEIFENYIWKQIYDEYAFNSGIIEVLKSKAKKITSIDIYFAFWCGDSENNVPPFIRIIDEIGENIQVNYYVVDRKKKGEKYYFEKLKVERVPTFIIFNDEKEVGRIIENPKKTLEEDLLEILF